MIEAHWRRGERTKRKESMCTSNEWASGKLPVRDHHLGARYFHICVWRTSSFQKVINFKSTNMWYTSFIKCILFGNGTGT